MAVASLNDSISTTFFNEDYVSVLSRPMPGINFEFFIGITPKFTCNDKNDEINY